MKEKLAAVLINHWFVIDKARSIGRLKREPRSKRYNDLKTFDTLGEAEKKSLLRGFINYNGKNCIQNYKEIAESIGNKEGSNIKISVGNATKNGIQFSFNLDNCSPTFAAGVLRALSWPGQSATVIEALDAVNNYGFLSTNISFTEINPKYAAYENYRELDKEFNNKIEAVKRLLSTVSYVVANLSDNELKLVSNNKRYVGFKDPIYDESGFSASEVILEETPEAKAQRIMLEKLEAARKARQMIIESTHRDTTTNTLTIHLDDDRHIEIETRNLIS